MKNNWISVKNRLPEKDDMVLAYFEYTGIDIYKYEYVKNEDIEGACFYNGNGYLIDDVTHWMPLPKPPSR